MRNSILAGVVALSILGVSSTAHAQVTPPPSRDATWGGVTDATTVAAVAAGLIMPRIFYPGSEVTTGWHARWHYSVLAPMMTYSTLAFVNENFMKVKIAGPRPGCDDTNAGGPGCSDFGSPSTHAFAAGATLGHGLAVFIIDTTKWSDGQVSGLGLFGHVGIPLILGGITVVGRSQGNYENGGQLAAGATLGLGIGFLTGMLYSTMARPECGYSGSMICW